MKQACVLCGYSYAPEETVTFQVPHASPVHTRIVCLDCIDDLQSLADKKAGAALVASLPSEDDAQRSAD